MTDLVPAFRAVGLDVNLAKCEVWGPAGALVAHTCPGVKLIPWDTKSGVVVLGCPVNFPGTTTFQDIVWEDRVEQLRKATELLSKMLDAQLGHHLRGSAWMHAR